MELPPDLKDELLARGTLGPKVQLPEDPPKSSRRKSTFRDPDTPKARPRGPTAEQEAFIGECLRRGLPAPYPEYPFAESVGRKFRADWLFDEWLIVEVQGGVYGRGKPCPACGRKPVGAHSSIADLKRDMERCRWMAILGYVFFPVRPEEVADGTAFTLIALALQGQ